MANTFDALHERVVLENRSPDRTFAVLTHLSGLAGYAPVLPLLGNVAVPLVIWLVRRRTDPEIEAHAREVLNFQITALIAGVVAGLLVFVVVGLVLLPLVAVVQVVLSCLGAYYASQGELLRYPFTPQWVRAPEPDSGPNAQI